jgi:hypothetical protein
VTFLSYHLMATKMVGQPWPAKFWWWQKQIEGVDMEAHIYRRLSSYVVLLYLLQLASTPGIHVQIWLTMMTRSARQPECRVGQFALLGFLRPPLRSTLWYGCWRSSSATLLEISVKGLNEGLQKIGLRCQTRAM